MLSRDDSILFFTFIIPLLIALAAFPAACTLSFSNVSTHGAADHLIDEKQTATSDLKADLKMDGLE